MTSGIYSKKCLFALIAVIWTSANPSHAQSLLHDFENLFERCRMSIETSSTFNIEGLQPRAVAERLLRDWGEDTAQEAWMPPESDLSVVLTEWTARDGTTRHLCDIALVDDGYVLAPSEQGMLLRHFLKKQVELIGAGTHEIDAQLSPIPPLINAAFLMSDRSPRGCIVSNNLALLPDGTFFSAGSGEQAIRPCKKD